MKLIPEKELQQMLERSDMAAEITLPADKFRDLVLQAGAVEFKCSECGTDISENPAGCESLYCPSIQRDRAQR